MWCFVHEREIQRQLSLNNPSLRTSYYINFVSFRQRFMFGCGIENFSILDIVAPSKSWLHKLFTTTASLKQLSWDRNKTVHSKVVATFCCSTVVIQTNISIQSATTTCTIKNSLLCFLQFLKACLSPHWQNFKVEFYPKTVFFQCKFRISRSTILHAQKLTDWTSEGWIEDKMTSKTH